MPVGPAELLAGLLSGGHDALEGNQRGEWIGHFDYASRPLGSQSPTLGAVRAPSAGLIVTTQRWCNPR
ncbi:hypothetical protein GCM10010409_10130 [Mycolicibacterium diernhoferi]